MTRAALTADTTLIAEQRGGRPRIHWSQAWPVLMRLTAPAQVHLVHGAGGPLGGDAFALSAQVGRGAALRVRSAGATIVQPGTGDSARWDVDADVDEAGHLDWGPDATVVCDGGALESRLRVRLAPGAGAVLRELVVLGRHGERGGRYRGELLVEVDGSPLLSHRTLLDGADPVLCGPAGTAGARAVGTLVVAGADVQRVSDLGDAGAGEERGLRWSWTDLDGPGRVLLAVGEPRLVAELLDAQRAALDPDPGPARAARPGVPHPDLAAPVDLAAAAPRGPDLAVARTDVARTAVARTDVARTDVARTDVARTDVARTDVARTDVARVAAGPGSPPAQTRIVDRTRSSP